MAHLTVREGRLPGGLSVEDTELEGFAQDHAAGGWQVAFTHMSPLLSPLLCVPPALSAGVGTGAVTTVHLPLRGGLEDRRGRQACCCPEPAPDRRRASGKYHLGAAVQALGSVYSERF